jgi:casein kinase 1|tara:strand:+ start:125 stop:973 length:849 start_codon:yes stop_codon:yes gene_type:complete
MNDIKNHIIKNKYKVDSLIGSGNFSNIYSGINIKNNNKIAIKIESNNNMLKVLKNEVKILNYLQSNHCKNIPILYWYGNYLNYKCVTMNLFEYTLKDIMYNDISIHNINNCIVKLINIINNIHDFYVVHRDIKPENIMFKNNDIFFIDFGLSTFYINEESNHYPNTSTNHIIGSPNYISHHIHEGNSYSRRDDLISIGYIYIEMVYKTLPWKNLKSFDDENYNHTHILNKNNQIKKHKKSLENLSQYLSDNKRMYDFIEYLCNLDYKTKPSYNYLIHNISNN